MTLLAATSTPNGPPVWWLAIVALTVLGIYALICWWRPFATCGVCSGNGSRGKRGRDCWWCHGRQVRLRWGRRVYNWYARARAAAITRRAAASGD
jgi:hypothetical protein